MKFRRVLFYISLFFFLNAHAVAEDKRHEFSQPLMGMAFRIVLYSNDEALAKRASDEAFNRVAEINKIMSDYDPESELNKLSDLAGSGKAARISDDLFHVLQSGQLLASNSNGAFDVAAGASTRLWRRARRLNRMPPEHAIQDAKKLSGFKYLKLNKVHKTAELLKSGVRLDLGGIAKGFALDEAFVVLRRNGLLRTLVAAGGDIISGNPPPSKPGWKVALLGLNDSSVEYIWLKNSAVATSGDLFQFLELDGKRYSHIIDPRSGRAIVEQRLVHVLAPNAMQADSLATAISVMGQEKGLLLVSGDKRLGVRVAFRNDFGQVKKESNRVFQTWPRVGD